MTDEDDMRDRFAAAALTGLTHPEDGQAGPLRIELVCTMAYRWADAMLRERAKTNHDAAPAARARTDADRNRTDKAALRPGKGAGNTHPMQTTPGECSKPREGT